MEPSRFNTYMFQEIFEKGEFASCVIITFQVMTVSRVSPRDPDAISPVAESGQNKFGTHSTGARNSDNPYVRWVLKAAYASQVGCPITAPVTEESRNLWLPIIHI